MMFDWTVNLGHVFTIVSFLLVSMGFVYAMRGKIDGMSSRLKLLESDIKSLITILIQQGKHEERMTAMDARLINQGMRLDDITRRFNDKLDK